MRVADLLDTLDRLAPAALAQPGDNCGLLVGEREAGVARVLTALELTDAVLAEASAGGYDTIITHHPLLFSPVRSLVESHPRERLLRASVREGISLIACHTNLDAATGGLADIAGRALGLQDMAPLEAAPANWYKLVGFVPRDEVQRVAAAVFAAGAGAIGGYRDCAFSTEGVGWFTALPGSHPTVGEVSIPERTPEVRWETVVPANSLAGAIRAFLGAHPYEEPAFDVYPTQDVLARVGLGRVGMLSAPTTLRELAARSAALFEAGMAKWSGDGERSVRRVAVLPGSGRGMIEAAAGQCEVLITGDLSYHVAEEAAERGLCVIDVPHGDVEWWAFRRWVGERLAPELTAEGVELLVSRDWRSPWSLASPGRVLAVPSVSPGEGDMMNEAPRVKQARVWIDGGSRGNPGPSAIGVVLEDGGGRVLETLSQAIGVGTNNVAEYRALLAGLEMAKRLEVREVEVISDSELLVRQMRGEYRVKNEGLKPLHAEARELAAGLDSFSIRHVGREQNSRADALVNEALDEQ